MAKYKKQIGDFSKLIEGMLQKAKSPEVSRVIGEKVVDIIRTRTRRGYGVTGSNLTRLKPLSKLHVEFRKTQRLHPETSPGTSNLTLTGELLDSMTVKSSRNGFSIFFKGARNEKVVGHVSETRPFFGLAKSETEEITNFFRRTFGDLVKRSKR
jgi:hypothetical protein